MVRKESCQARSVGLFHRNAHQIQQRIHHASTRTRADAVEDQWKQQCGLSIVDGASCPHPNIPTTYQPHTGHIPSHTNGIPTTCQPHTDHIPGPHTNHTPITYQPHTNLIPTTYQPHIETYQPHTNHISTTCQPHTDHIPGPHTNHIPITYQPHTNLIPTTYQPHIETYQPHTNHISTTYQPHTDQITSIYKNIPDETEIVIAESKNIKRAVNTPSHLIKVVNICRYFVFWTLKNAKGPRVSAKAAWSEIQHENQQRTHIQYDWCYTGCQTS